MRDHRIAKEAEAELDAIWRYTAEGSGSYAIADRVVDGLIDGILLLVRHPHLGRRRDHDLRPGLRTFAVGEYIIIYRFQEEDLLILHVVRGSRDIAALLG
jgi:toxin ParE1/3/4